MISLKTVKKLLAAKLKSLFTNSYNRDFLTNRQIRFTQLSILFNAVLVLGKIGLGIYSSSLFLCVGGLFNICVIAAKFVMLKSHNQRDQLKHYRIVGLIILFASLFFMVYCGIMVFRNDANFHYDVIISISIATFTFSEIGVAVHGIVAAKKLNNLMLASAKQTNLVSALVSIVLTQSALLSLSDIANAARYCGIVGLLVGIISAAIGVLMARK